MCVSCEPNTGKQASASAVLFVGRNVMGQHGREFLLVLTLTLCAIPHGRGFVPIPAASSAIATPKLNTRYAGSVAINSRSSCTALFSSPFENFDNYDEEDITKREAEQLEEMIRGRRGIVIEMVEREWKEEMSNTMQVDGTRLCAEAYEGFQTRGRGAIFVSNSVYAPDCQRWNVASGTCVFVCAVLLVESCFPSWSLVLCLCVYTVVPPRPCRVQTCLDLNGQL